MPCSRAPATFLCALGSHPLSTKPRWTACKHVCFWIMVHLLKLKSVNFYTLSPSKTARVSRNSLSLQSTIKSFCRLRTICLYVYLLSNSSEANRPSLLWAMITICGLLRAQRHADASVTLKTHLAGWISGPVKILKYLMCCDELMTARGSKGIYLNRVPRICEL